MDPARACTEAKAGRRGFGETRRAAIVFWVLALLFVASRVYLTDAPAGQGMAEVSAPAAAQVVILR